jgi:hypothetical protein
VCVLSWASNQVIRATAGGTWQGRIERRLSLHGTSWVVEKEEMMRKLVGPLLAATFAIGVTANSAIADDHGPQFTFGASSSFAYDFNRPSQAAQVSANTPPNRNYNRLGYASLEQDRSFNIDLLQLGITGQRGRLRYGATLDFGDLAKRAGDSLDGDLAVQTAWIGYDADPVGFTVGRVPTPIGFEVLEPWGRPNISSSYNWQFQPVNHDGLTIQGGNDMVELMIGIANTFTVADDPINSLPANDLNSDKSFFGSGNVAIADELNLYVSGIVGNEVYSGVKTDVAMVNFIASGNFEVAGNTTLRYAAEFNGRHNDPQTGQGRLARMWGVAAYLGGDFGPTGIDLRYEYVDDGGILFQEYAGGSEVQSFTATGSWAFVEGVEFRLEYRYNTSNNDIYAKKANTYSKDDQNIVQAQVVWYPEI